VITGYCSYPLFVFTREAKRKTPREPREESSGPQTKKKKKKLSFAADDDEEEEIV
jgi:hypothetical protein